MRPVTLLAATALVACTSPQRPVSFIVEASQKERSVDEVVHALASLGYRADRVDAQAGVVHTSWQDTGYGYGYVGDAEATVVRRYTVTLKPEGRDVLLTLRADTKKCARGGFEVDGHLVTGRCETMDELVGDHQRELDELGKKLQSTLTTGLVTTPRQ